METSATLMQELQQLANNVINGDKRSIARAITLIENNGEKAQRLIALLYPHTGKTHIVGITGPGGSGKSTLIEKIISELRRRGKTVGVVATDPSSPFTGGAFLGDRIRMQKFTTDDDVFIRSMATRNVPGGIAKATREAVMVLDAAGKDVVIVETVGAGQAEVDIIKVAHTVVVVFAPGLGDEIQAIKAGIMEIADIFVVNKADLENANKAVTDIKASLELNTKEKAWKPPVLQTIALTGEGIEQLVNEIFQHKTFLEKGAGISKRRKKVETELVEAIKDKVADLIIEKLRKKKGFNELVEKILNRKIDPYSAATKLVSELTFNQKED
jgi:LAO/AO transport system kinase